MQLSLLAKKILIFVHRWMGVALSVLFLLWFTSGVVMMYWGFPSVRAEDRLERAPALDSSRVRLSPAQAFASLHTPQMPAQIRLNVFDGRPAYRFRSGRSERIVYADTGEEQTSIDPAMVSRIASTWARQPEAAAQVESIHEVDQWTVQGALRNLRPLWKYAWPNGEEVYVSGVTGEVVQYTTSRSRFWAYLGAIPHWLYFTPLRKHQPEWSRFVIWTSGAGTLAAALGIAIGIWMYSPSKRYRHSGAATSIPYRGQKRWHAIFGLIFGLGAVTWAFSGMLSMDPFPTRATGGPRAERGADIGRALSGRFEFAAFEPKSPHEALLEVSNLKVKELELTYIAQEPVYLATIARGDTRIIPVHGAPVPDVGADRVIAIIRRSVQPAKIAELRLLKGYDSYYLDRRYERPLPVVLLELNDVDHTRYYIDPKTARIAGSYNSRLWMSRWLYHGLHSLDFPWLYKRRPLWDIVVLGFMAGGTALCATSLILVWRVVTRRFMRLLGTGHEATASEDLSDAAQSTQ
jgi:hypothetical protein